MQKGVVFGEAALVIEKLFTVMMSLHYRLEQVDGMGDYLGAPANA